MELINDIMRHWHYSFGQAFWMAQHLELLPVADLVQVSAINDACELL